uniref:Integrase catalytic domain-containing protein n=1 Tax=Lygus hesperus TaxID=30085 RepID=A0A0A9VSQ4_LYGHE
MQESTLAGIQSGAPFERVAIDVVGPLPKSDKGNRFIVVVMDYFTKWPEAYPVVDQKAETVAEGLVTHVISRFGIPQELHSDQGTNFESCVFQEVVKLLGIRKTRTTPLHPQSNGLVERFNRTLWNLLAKMVSDHQRDWDQHLPIALMAYRATNHASTGFSPAMLMLGRELTLPVTLLYGRVPHQDAVTDYAKMLLDRLESVHQETRDRLGKTADNVRKRYNPRVGMPLFKEGDQVWYYWPRRKVGHCPKLQSPWVGPCTVRKSITDVVFRILLPSGRKCVVHADRLAEYRKNGREK